MTADNPSPTVDAIQEPGLTNTGKALWQLLSRIGGIRHYANVPITTQLFTNSQFFRIPGFYDSQ